MPVLTLTILKGAFLVLFYIFVFWALRVSVRQISDAPEIAKPGPRDAVKRPTNIRIVEPREFRDMAFPLTHAMTLGRGADCTIRLDDQWLSTQHARILDAMGDWVIEDAGSTNGTYVNREQIFEPTTVRRGDTIQIGRTVLEVAE